MQINKIFSKYIFSSPLSGCLVRHGDAKGIFLRLGYLTSLATNHSSLNPLQEVFIFFSTISLLFFLSHVQFSCDVSHFCQSYEISIYLPVPGYLSLPLSFSLSIEEVHAKKNNRISVHAGQEYSLNPPSGHRKYAPLVLSLFFLSFPIFFVAQRKILSF